MKSVLLLSLLVLLALSLVGCSPDIKPVAEAAGLETQTDRLGQAATPSPELSSTQGSATPSPTGTPEPRADRYYRSYPAPTGAPAFRRYYQIRCYPGCHYSATPAVPSEAAVHTTTVAQPTRERPYRSYPAPTGVAGFRHYYQIRCYPGCHSYPNATPVPTRIHP